MIFFYVFYLLAKIFITATWGGWNDFHALHQTISTTVDTVWYWQFLYPRAGSDSYKQFSNVAPMLDHVSSFSSYRVLIPAFSTHIVLSRYVSPWSARSAKISAQISADTDDGGTRRCHRVFLTGEHDNAQSS